jgi:hypothetical protein
MSEPRIKVPAMAPWPNGHNTTEAKYSATSVGRAPKRIGDKIFTLGPPLTPSRFWICGTDVVWPVFEVDGIPTDCSEGFPCVCRHQIVAGD